MSSKSKLIFKLNSQIWMFLYCRVHHYGLYFRFFNCYLVLIFILVSVQMCQGQSLNQVALYLPRPVFTHGQLYVAMSRVTTPNGLRILDETSDMNGEDGVTNIVCKEIFKDV